jgi:dTDP-4-dehydrorhamnose reductase
VTAAPGGRALITGADGQVGLALRECVPRGWTVVACDRTELDVTSADEVHQAMERVRPVLVFHAAAYTAVDAAESDAGQAEAVNTGGTMHVAQAARQVGARLVHLSTDFVFDGSSGRPYSPEDRPAPLGVYGRTKLASEQAALGLGKQAVVVRTAWVYSRHGQNFVRTMLHLMREQESVGVVSDQVGTPTWARSLAEALWAVAARPGLHGVLHWTDAGVASWYDFAVAIQEEGFAAGLLERAVPVRPLSSREYPTAARRPAYSVLSKSESWAALGITPPHWRVNLRLMLQELARG